MSDSVAYSFLLTESALAGFVELLNAHLEPGLSLSSQRLRDCAHACTEHAISLRFAPDPVLLEFRNDHPDIACSIPSQIAIGYLFLSARMNAAHIDVSIYTSSRALVQVLKQSAQVWEFMVRLGQLGQPPEFRITDEWNEVTVVRSL